MTANGNVARPSSLERVLARDRLIIAAALGALVVLAWLYLALLGPEMGDMGADRTGPMPGMAEMPGAQAETTAPAFLPTALMWLVMMTGMMVPSATPMILLFGTVQRRQLASENPALRVALFTAGYLVAWGAFSAVAAAAQVALVERKMLAPMEPTVGAWLGTVLVALAGVYQLTPLKNVCLKHCRSPAEFLSTHWRRGSAGALRMGLEHGRYCVGCCWLLMSLLFAVGVMNLVWVAALAAFVLLEKLVPRGEAVARVSGMTLLLFAVYLGVSAARS
jgi:predicted metal-binding membrane protein